MVITIAMASLLATHWSSCSSHLFSLIPVPKTGGKLLALGEEEATLLAPQKQWDKALLDVAFT